MKQATIQKGFIQIPILIWVVASLLAVSAVGTGVVLYKQNKLPFISNNKAGVNSAIEDINQPVESEEAEKLRAEREAQELAEEQQKQEDIAKQQEAVELQQEQNKEQETQLSQTNQPASTSVPLIQTVQTPAPITSVPVSNENSLSATEEEENVEIFSISVSADRESAVIGWKTNVPTNSKIFVWKVNSSTSVFNSSSGLSTSHSVNVTDLTAGQDYFYEIEAVSSDNKIGRDSSSFTTLPPLPIIDGNLTLTLSPDNPESSNHPNDRTSGSHNIPLLKFTLTASETDVSLIKLGVFMASDTDNLILPTVIYLYDGDTVIASATDTTTRDVATFENFTLPVHVGTPKTLTIKGDYLAVGSTANTNAANQNDAFIAIPATSANSQFMTKIGKIINTTIPNAIQGNIQYLGK